MARPAHQTVNYRVASLDNRLSHKPGQRTADTLSFLNNLLRVFEIVLLPDSFRFDPGTHSEQPPELEATDEPRVSITQLLVHLHHLPLIKNQSLNARHNAVGGVITVPAVFAQSLVHLDNFFAVLSPATPECDVSQDRRVQDELARGLLEVRFHQAAAKRLVRNFGLAT